jgi:hypothetical protein
MDENSISIDMIKDTNVLEEHRERLKALNSIYERVQEADQSVIEFDNEVIRMIVGDNKKRNGLVYRILSMYGGGEVSDDEVEYGDVEEESEEASEEEESEEDESESKEEESEEDESESKEEESEEDDKKTEDESEEESEEEDDEPEEEDDEPEEKKDSEEEDSEEEEEEKPPKRMIRRTKSVPPKKVAPQISNSPEKKVIKRVVKKSVQKKVEKPTPKLVQKRVVKKPVQKKVETEKPTPKLVQKRVAKKPVQKKVETEKPTLKKRLPLPTKSVQKVADETVISEEITPISEIYPRSELIDKLPVQSKQKTHITPKVNRFVSKMMVYPLLKMEFVYNNTLDIVQDYVGAATTIIGIGIRAIDGCVIKDLMDQLLDIRSCIQDKIDELGASITQADSELSRHQMSKIASIKTRQDILSLMNSEPRNKTDHTRSLRRINMDISRTDNDITRTNRRLDSIYGERNKVIELFTNTLMYAKGQIESV